GLEIRRSAMGRWGVTLGMDVLSPGLAFDQTRPSLRAGATHGLACRVVHRQNVVAVDDLAGHAVSSGQVGHIARGKATFDGCVGGVVIVLAHPHYWQV